MKSVLTASVHLLNQGFDIVIVSGLLASLHHVSHILEFVLFHQRVSGILVGIDQSPEAVKVAWQDVLVNIDHCLATYSFLKVCENVIYHHATINLLVKV